MADRASTLVEKQNGFWASLRARAGVDAAEVVINRQPMPSERRMPESGAMPIELALAKQAPATTHAMSHTTSSPISSPIAQNPVADTSTSMFDASPFNAGDKRLPNLLVQPQVFEQVGRHWRYRRPEDVPRLFSNVRDGELRRLRLALNRVNEGLDARAGAADIVSRIELERRIYQELISLDQRSGPEFYFGELAHRPWGSVTHLQDRVQAARARARQVLRTVGFDGAVIVLHIGYNPLSGLRTSNLAVFTRFVGWSSSPINPAEAAWRIERARLLWRDYGCAGRPAVSAPIVHEDELGRALAFVTEQSLASTPLTGVHLADPVVLSARKSAADPINLQDAPAVVQLRANQLLSALSLSDVVRGFRGGKAVVTRALMAAR